MPQKLQLALLRVFGVLPRRLRVLIVHLFAPSFSVGALAVVERDDGRVLMARHSYRPRWGLPGGLLQRGEEAVDGVVRETLEEVGLEIDVLGAPTVVVAADSRRVDVIFRARLLDGADPDAAEPRSPEILEVRWVHPDALPPLEPETEEAFAALRRL